MFSFYFCNCLITHSEEPSAKLPGGVAFRWRCDTGSEAGLLHPGQIFGTSGRLPPQIPHCEGLCHCLHVPSSLVGDDCLAHLHARDPWARIPPPHCYSSTPPVAHGDFCTCGQISDVLIWLCVQFAIFLTEKLPETIIGVKLRYHLLCWWYRSRLMDHISVLFSLSLMPIHCLQITTNLPTSSYTQYNL